MAEAAISFAVEKLRALAIEKVSFLLHVDEQLIQLKDDLKDMQRFLKYAAEKQAEDERIRGWISDIRSVAHDSEDVIEIFALKVDAGPPQKPGLLEWCGCFPGHLYNLDRLLGWCGWFPGHLYNLDSVGQQIQGIQNRLSKIDKSRERFGIRNLEEGSGSGSKKRLENVERRRRVYPWETVKHVVGLEEAVETLVKKVVLDDDKGSGLQVASIVGMPGSGKSTLARKLYNHAVVGERFEKRAWVCVSREYNVKEVMKEVMMQVVERDEEKVAVAGTIKESSEGEVLRMVHERLRGKKYFIVVDDVWQQSDWGNLASAFPDQQGKASRLLVTSRMHNIPGGAQYVHEHNGLDTNKSWELLLKVALTDNHDGKCPPELENTARKILEQCNGLPLAITVMGGLLRKEGESKSRWEKALKGMSSYLGKNDDSVLSILELSYQDLPSHLKPCFLCLSFFKEDATILARNLIIVWIAEGFITRETGQEETLEEIARSYLDDLINRNMIQVKDLGKDATRVKNCQVHDLLHDLSIRKAKEEINYEILKESSDSTLLEKTRHCTIYYSNELGLPSSGENPHLRSLFLYGSKGSIDAIPPDYWKGFEILRLLELEGLGMKILPESICTMIALRYLGLKDNKLKKLPESLGRLKRLQLLDLTGSRDMEVPNIIWQLEELRHLFLHRQIICKERLKLDTLKQLQTLSFVWTNRIVVEHLAELTSLCKLGVGLKEGVELSKFFVAMGRLKNFVSMDVTFDEGIFSTIEGLGSLQHLDRLKIRYPMPKLPSSSNDLPRNLSYVTLIETKLKQDPMPVLEWLPNLVYIKMDQGLDIEETLIEEMVISQGGFPVLRELYLKDLWYLKKMQLGEGGMLKLERLNIQFCPRLMIVPQKEEMRLMSNLKELKMLYVTSKNISKLHDPLYSQIFSNIPSVEIEHKYDF